MASLTGFPLCCGADVFYSFGVGTQVQNPDQVSGYQLTADKMAYAKDANGNHIPITFAEKMKEEFEKKRAQMPNRAYFSILNKSQYEAHENAWPKFLKSLGFEFVCGWSNSSHDGSAYGNSDAITVHPNYLFVLCTDDKGRYGDHHQPPPGWDAMPGVTPSDTLASRKAA